jgi:hypothetical protein
MPMLYRVPVRPHPATHVRHRTRTRGRPSLAFQPLPSVIGASHGTKPACFVLPPDVLHAQRERAPTKSGHGRQNTRANARFTVETRSPRPQSVHASDVTGPHQIARNNAPQSHHTAAPGRHPAEQPSRVLLTSVSSTHPWVAPAPKPSIEGSLSPMRMSSSTRDPTCAHIWRCESCKHRLQNS